jgi:hypothetical protein
VHAILYLIEQIAIISEETTSNRTRCNLSEWLCFQWRSQPKIIGHAPSNEVARLSRGGWGHAPPRKFLKIRTPEMPFPAILALNSKLQYDLKKGQNFAILPYFSQK